MGRLSIHRDTLFDRGAQHRAELLRSLGLAMLRTGSLFVLGLRLLLLGCSLFARLSFSRIREDVGVDWGAFQR